MSSPRISAQRDFTLLPPLPETPRGSATSGTIELPPLKNTKLIAAHLDGRASVTVQPGPKRSLRRAAMDAFKSVRDSFKSLKVLISTAQEHRFQKGLLAKGMRALRTFNTLANRPGLSDRAQQLEKAGTALDRVVSQMSDETIEALLSQEFAQLSKVDLTAASVHATAKQQSVAVDSARGNFGQVNPSAQMTSFASGLKEQLLNNFRERLPELVEKDLSGFQGDEGTFFRDGTERSVALVALMHDSITAEQKNDWEDKAIKWATPATPLPLRVGTQGVIVDKESLTPVQTDAVEKCVIDFTRGLLQELEQSMPQGWRDLLQIQDNVLKSNAAGDEKRRKAVIDAVFLRVVSSMLLELGNDTRCTDEQKAVIRHVAGQVQRVANGVKAADPDLVRVVKEFALQLLEP